MKAACAHCKNTRKKLYNHVSGLQLCRHCLVTLAREGRPDFRYKKVCK